ncbi:MAG TPA: AarF/ABC1/UbiB kinase family protein [Pirellulales bacterium]|nr:AarF/ABC1/UbiB kinase family protein [Pirellulales bacterium]
MALALDELLAALPAEADEAAPPAAAIKEIFEKLSYRPVPVGSLARLWTLGTLQAKIAAAYLAYWVRCGFLSSDEAARRLNDTHLAAAIKLLGGMSYLRGAIMKVGQVLANYPKVLPAQYAEALARLHFEAPPMHYSLLREQVRNELGRDPEDLFESFETRAFAAASLGQVHRARLRSGEPVAVKIQYPNIARTIRSDFRNLSAVLLPMRLTSDWENQREQFEYIRRTLETETDYEHEAEALRRVRHCLSDDDEIVVPRVYAELSTRRVLTMDYLPGKHLEALLAANPPQELRDRHGAQIMRSSLAIYYRAKLLYSDVQPGNFLFLEDGRLGLLDFGGCRTFSDDEWDMIRLGHKAFRGTRQDMIEHCVRGAMLTEAQRADGEYIKLLEDINYWLWEPFKHDGRFDFGDAAYFQRGVDLYGEMFRQRRTRGMTVVPLMTRMFLGFRAMAFRLGCRVDARQAMEEELRPLGW